MECVMGSRQTNATRNGAVLPEASVTEKAFGLMLKRSHATAGSIYAPAYKS